MHFFYFRQVAEIEKSPKTIVVPRYQPVFVEPNLKEYETQVLQMSVPIDDSDLRGIMEFDQHPKNLKYQASFSLDNISYITKDRTG
jgi:protocadherin-15